MKFSLNQLGSDKFIVLHGKQYAGISTVMHDLLQYYKDIHSARHLPKSLKEDIEHLAYLPPGVNRTLPRGGANFQLGLEVLNEILTHQYVGAY